MDPISLIKSNLIGRSRGNGLWVASHWLSPWSEGQQTWSNINPNQASLILSVNLHIIFDWTAYFISVKLKIFWGFTHKHTCKENPRALYTRIIFFGYYLTCDSIYLHKKEQTKTTLINENDIWSNWWPLQVLEPKLKPKFMIH